MKRTIGLIVNPLAGMGGSVGLKGTDGGMYTKALELGAAPVTPKRTKELLSHMQHKEEMMLLAAPGKMGSQYVKPFGVAFAVVGAIGEETPAVGRRHCTGDCVGACASGDWQSQGRRPCAGHKRVALEGMPFAFVGRVTEGAGVRVVKDGEASQYTEIRCADDELARMWALYPRDG